MDESYMREYFERNQEVFYMRFRKDESKWALEKERAQAVDSFREKYVHGEAMEVLSMLLRLCMEQPGLWNC